MKGKERRSGDNRRAAKMSRERIGKGAYMFSSGM